MHASLRYQDQAWFVQDRNSTNGTWLNGVCLSRGKTEALLAGSTLRFGAKNHEEWQLYDASPPADAPPVPSTAAYERVIQDIDLLIRSDLTLELGVRGETYRLPARVPYVVLQALANERLQDRERGLAEEDEGWVDRELLSRRLRRSELNQDIRRIRDDFKKLQLFEAAEDVIQTHRDQGKIRIGIARLRIEKLEQPCRV